jgi:23S rRNA (cytidine1920-2'-O)/16S rRNA (cytidine1409-2'-O)-methyltransferase
MEKTNARHLKPDQMPESFTPADVAVIDCSFISLKKILPTAVALLKTDGKIVALVKPQFEAGKAEADKGRGVITDSAMHERVLAELEDVCRRANRVALARRDGVAVARPGGQQRIFGAD